MRKISASVAVTSIVTSILVLYNVMIYRSGPIDLVLLIFCISPILMAWLVMTILKDKTSQGPELRPGEHWGYQDRNKEDLDVF
jgi:hypothetical protein